MRALLFSGGLDSTALAWMLRPEKLVFFDYGQRPAKGEERAARAVASTVGIPLDVRRVDMSAFGHGTMSTSGIPLASALKTPEFWPYRNQMLITLAAMTYAADPLVEILVGTVIGDDAHPDGRKEFVSAIDRLIRQQSGVRVVAPAIEMTTLQLLRKAAVPKSVLGWTFSCHTGEWACGDCRGCNKHRQVIERLEAGT
ncbi:MAG: 7-cyano-7-deazaguanine synthase [Bradyrhizobium sp.]|nr:7-cyano-7-deazaguanine synthase [Bradyrhizobium sp.]